MIRYYFCRVQSQAWTKTSQKIAVPSRFSGICRCQADFVWETCARHEWPLWDFCSRFPHLNGPTIPRIDLPSFAAFLEYHLGFHWAAYIYKLDSSCIFNSPKLAKIKFKFKVSSSYGFGVFLHFIGKRHYLPAYLKLVHGFF